MKCFVYWYTALTVLSVRLIFTQETTPAPVFTRADTLRGMNSPERTCYDIKYYHLDVKIDPMAQSIEGSNTIDFVVDSSFDRMQIGLFKNMDIAKIVLDGETTLQFDREYDAVIIHTPHLLEKSSHHSIRIFYSGKPTIAKNPPWDGGFTWTQDSTGNPWAVVTCQGTGASLWWPNKDHQADEPDSMLISVTVPKGLMDISNGRLRATTELPDGWTRYDWFVSYPINNYCVTVNIGKYAHFADTFENGEPLSLDYYVLPQNLERAKEQFKQAKTMMEAFEKYFGPYPFIRDGYKLVECPHNGMEHQSAVAYGNRYVGGYRGRSSSEVGLKFDFIIIHESAHEWWGNSVTAKDVADMWIHESFGAYAEALYVEYVYGHEEALKYINGKKQNVRNTEPMIGTYNVQHEGSGDMYDKGQLVLNTLRSVIDNDDVWFSILRGIQDTFKYQTINAEDLFNFINRKTGKDYTYFFNQYWRNPKIPTLELGVREKGDSVSLNYRWKADVKDFHMPIKVTTSKNRYEFIYPTTTRQSMTLKNIKPEDFKVADDLFYISVLIYRNYVDPRLEE
jgi:aminopeptidase N